MHPKLNTVFAVFIIPLTPKDILGQVRRVMLHFHSILAAFLTQKQQ